MTLAAARLSLPPLAVIGYRRDGRPIRFIGGGSESPPEGGAPADDDGEKPSAPAAEDKGYPADTPLAEMTPEQREAYWKHQARKHETRANARQDYDDIKAERDQLKQATETASDKAIREAKQAARLEALAEAAPRLVAAEFRAAAKGVLTKEQVDELLEDLNTAKYLDDKGEVDVVRIERKVAAFAPSGGADGAGGRQGRHADAGQGRRGPAGASKRDAGLEEARRRGYVTAGQQ